jgi:hypothetical protein
MFIKLSGNRTKLYQLQDDLESMTRAPLMTIFDVSASQPFSLRRARGRLPMGIERLTGLKKAKSDLDDSEEIRSQQS